MNSQTYPFKECKECCLKTIGACTIAADLKSCSNPNANKVCFYTTHNPQIWTIPQGKCGICNSHTPSSVIINHKHGIYLCKEHQTDENVSYLMGEICVKKE